MAGVGKSINIQTATVEELKQIRYYVGDKIAERIVQIRESQDIPITLYQILSLGKLSHWEMVETGEIIGLEIPDPLSDLDKLTLNTTPDIPQVNFKSESDTESVKVNTSDLNVDAVSNIIQDTIAVTANTGRPGRVSLDILGRSRYDSRTWTNGNRYNRPYRDQEQPRRYERYNNSQEQDREPPHRYNDRRSSNFDRDYRVRRSDRSESETEHSQSDSGRSRRRGKRNNNSSPIRDMSRIIEVVQGLMTLRQMLGYDYRNN
ncbi:hypothetical protein LOTGIDRAFT_173495 [Lottia gigantea]|uniref:Uncharacterized protein n=1 Tax=Lottia gigantea TaxID=225164 RepID=V4ARJ4_LOTGI|nr:hypothetical protein LOTGIDRAFT_173495 [Lottia gigantea]ESO99837.1 hypothetical protein LOTGIDRAFT_173495 [Lottia gigantea]